MIKLVVFDLDFTLWDAGGTWCDQTYPPFSNKNGEVFDATGAHIKLYDEVFEILNYLKEQNFAIAAASRTGAPKIAQRLIDLFEIDHFFDYKQIYPASKINHFRELKADSGYEYNEMLFFDDEYRNIEEVSQLGVKSVIVNDGINKTLIRNSLRKL